MGAIGECGALFDEIVNPWEHVRMWKVNVASLDQGAHSGGWCNLPTLGVYGNDAGNLMLEHLDNGRSVGLVLDQFPNAARPLDRQFADGFYCSREVHAAADLIE